MLYDAGSNKKLGENILPEVCRIIDLSPDGSLVLTGNEAPTGGSATGPRYSSLDIWMPSREKHALRWVPLVGPPGAIGSYPDWAAFVSRNQVLTRSDLGLVLWELGGNPPVSKAIYSINNFGKVVALSPTRKYVVGWNNQAGTDQKQRNAFNIYETATGKCVGNLQRPDLLAVGAFPKGWFRPDAQQLFTQDGNEVAIYDLTNGQKEQQYLNPVTFPVAVEWITPEHVVQGCAYTQYLVNPQSRSILCKYDSREKRYIHNVGSLDGRVWLEATARDGSGFELRALSFPIPPDPGTARGTIEISANFRTAKQLNIPQRLLGE